MHDAPLESNMRIRNTHVVPSRWLVIGWVALWITALLQGELSSDERGVAALSARDLLTHLDQGADLEDHRQPQSQQARIQ